MLEPILGTWIKVFSEKSASNTVQRTSAPSGQIMETQLSVLHLNDGTDRMEASKRSPLQVSRLVYVLQVLEVNFSREH